MTKPDEELDPIKVRTALLAIVAAMLESAHDAAEKGQLAKADANNVTDCIIDIREILDEVIVQLDAAQIIAKL